MATYDSPGEDDSSNWWLDAQIAGQMSLFIVDHLVIGDPLSVTFIIE